MQTIRNVGEHVNRNINTNDFHVLCKCCVLNIIKDRIRLKTRILMHSYTHSVTSHEMNL